MVFAGAALTGCGDTEKETEIPEGSQADVSQTGSGKTAIAPVDPPTAWDKEADVIVIGSGGGGLNAASRAREQGLSVILIERSSMFGGNTISASMFTVPGGTDIQNEAEVAVPEFPWDPKKCTDHLLTGLGWSGNPEMTYHILDNLPAVHKWMTETYKLEWTLGHDGTYLSVAPLGMAKIIDAAVEYAEGLGAELLASTAAVALVKDGDRIVGVKAETTDGKELFLRGTKAVLMTAGGFAANKELLAEYCPSAIKRAASCYLTSSDQGDCFRMGLGVGAQVASKNVFVMFDGGMEWENYGGQWCRYLYDGSTQLVRQPWFTIDRCGQRMRYITSTAPGALTDQAYIETATPGNRAFIIFDSKWDEYAVGFSQYACRTLVREGVPRYPFIPEYYQDYHNGINDAFEAGIIRTCDTLDELAESLGIGADTLKTAVEKWNATCAAGTDDFIYPMKDEWLHPIVEPPFHGACIGGNLFQTGTGLMINTEMQVLDTAGAVIPGLYAGWYTAGWCIGEDTAGSMLYDSGGVSKSFLGGYLAADAIAKLEK
jgi:hypothetical protein